MKRTVVTPEGQVEIDLTQEETDKRLAEVTQAVLDSSAHELKVNAIRALAQTDKTANRCLKAGIAFPVEWQTYVSDLRDVVSGISTILPTQPDYPAGS